MTIRHQLKGDGRTHEQHKPLRAVAYKAVQPRGMHLSVHVGISFDVPYDGRQFDASTFELVACLPDNWKLAVDDEEVARDLAYEEWPPAGERHGVGS